MCRPIPSTTIADKSAYSLCDVPGTHKWNESGFRPPLCTYRLNWARRTSWGWWDDWDDTVLQTQHSKFEPWRSEAEHATSRSRRLPTILTFTRGWGRNNLPGTHNVGLPTQYRFNVGHASQPIASSIPVNRIRRSPNIETELGDCPVFSLTAIRVTFYPPKGHYLDNTIHWSNCEIILGHRLRLWANITPIETL